MLHKTKSIQQLFFLLSVCVLFGGCFSPTHKSTEWTGEQYFKKLEYLATEDCWEKPLIVMEENSSGWYLDKISHNNEYRQIIGLRRFRVVYSCDDAFMPGDLIILSYHLFDPIPDKEIWKYIPRESNRKNDFYFAYFDNGYTIHEELVFENSNSRIFVKKVYMEDMSLVQLYYPFYIGNEDDNLNETPKMFEPEKAFEAYFMLRELYKNKGDN